MDNLYLIGLTGNLGSGKSTVRRMLEQLGARGIDADLLAHTALQRGSAVWFAVLGEFGVQVLKFNGEIDRSKLGGRVFGDPAALRRLEEITHPVVRARIQELLRHTHETVAVVEAVKLVESGLSNWCDAVWVVNCAPEIEIARVVRDRHMSEQDARARLDAQGSLDAKFKMAQVVIENTGDEEFTRAQTKRAWEAIQPLTARDKKAWLGLADPAGPTAPAQPTLPGGSTAAFAPPSPVISKSASPVQPGAPAAAIYPPASVSKPSTTAQPSAPLRVMEKPVRPESVASPGRTPSQREELVGSLPIEVRRARKDDLDALALAFARREKLSNPPSRPDALKRFGAHGYRVAAAPDRLVAFTAWEAENLVAVLLEPWAESAQFASSMTKLLELVETEAKQLQCEVSIMLIDPLAPEFLKEQARSFGFQPRKFQELHPVWRQVTAERLQQKDEIWVKRLREDLITQPF